eukprot:1746471-Karenia_brevis.AAC.1
MRSVPDTYGIDFEPEHFDDFKNEITAEVLHSEQCHLASSIIAIIVFLHIYIRAFSSGGDSMGSPPPSFELRSASGR